MLYDNAQLAVSYLESYQLSNDIFFAEVARDIFNYVLCDMTDSDGGFYSAEDADSYPAIDSNHFNTYSEGNVQNDPHGEFIKKNILIQRQTFEDAAKRFNMAEGEILTLVQSAIAKLFEARATRQRPHLDDKVLVSWNGLMISAFAKGYQILGNETYLNAATHAADFILKTLYNETTHTLLRRYRQGEAGIDGKLDDYAFFVQALLDLYETSLNPRYLTIAVRLTETMQKLFEDKTNGGFFNSQEDDASLILRMKDDHDSAEPSPNSVAALDLLRLAQMTDRDDLRISAEKILFYFSPLLDKSPTVLPQMLVALSFFRSQSKLF